jgi:DNA-binding transcriptional LysR family regulator
VIIAQSDPWAKKGAVHLAELAQRPLVMREEGSMTRRLIEAAFAAREAAPRVCLEVGSREAAKEAVAAGIGVGILLEGELRGDARLAELALTGTSIVGGVYAVALKEAVDIPVVGAFLSHAASFKPLMGG